MHPSCISHVTPNEHPVNPSCIPWWTLMYPLCIPHVTHVCPSCVSHVSPDSPWWTLSEPSMNPHISLMYFSCISQWTLMSPHVTLMYPIVTLTQWSLNRTSCYPSVNLHVVVVTLHYSRQRESRKSNKQVCQDSDLRLRVKINHILLSEPH